MVNPRDPGRPRYDMGTINGRRKLLVDGFDEALTAIVDTIGRTRPESVSFGYSLPGQGIGWDCMPEGHAPDPPPGTPVVWWFEVIWPDGTRQTAQTEPRTDHHRAVVEAGLQFLRDAGVNVTVIEEGS
ncbi:hypothetical protein KBX50_05085 [Micromonospora sp. C51]|uniref:hypothetical protein n=1 Tax=Micromonospora sp. C51 TaxID=2824879 RepID=UPI001B35C9A3|nr:hypothetical protein [Micromonospora sp. C51]MBQ1047832.1 hypothetical protein [Micromonospora sp. C51]